MRRLFQPLLQGNSTTLEMPPPTKSPEPRPKRASILVPSLAR